MIGLGERFATVDHVGERLDCVVFEQYKNQATYRYRSLAEQLVDQARADGKNLVGPGGLLSDLTKQVLETGLEVEMEEHLGYPKHAVEGRNHG